MERAIILLGVVLLGGSVLCVGCGDPAVLPRDGDPDSSGKPPVTVDKSQPDPVETAAVAGDPAARQPDEEGQAIFGRPIGYWAREARAAEKSQTPARIVEALMLGLQSEVVSVRVASADAVSALGTEGHRAIPALAAQLAHQVPWVRVAAMETLRGIGAPAVPELVKVVQNETGGPPVRACIVLANMGPEAKEAIPALKAMIDDESCAFRARIPGFLQQIDPDTGGQPDVAVTPHTDQPRAVTPDLPEMAPGEQPDWSGYHGPRRDSLCAETGLLKQWPDDGLKLLWKLEGLGTGFSTVSIAVLPGENGRIFTMGDRHPEGEEESQYAIAFDLETRRQLWATRVGPPHDDGPRCTPTVDVSPGEEERVYVLGTEGDLLCLAADTGQVRWRKNLATDFGGRMMTGWKFSESPLVDGERLICTPGGEEAAMVALNKSTGEVIWICAVPQIGEAGKDGAAYSSAVAAEIQGVRQYVQLIGRGVVGVDAETGTFLWGYNRIANSVANVTTPVVRGDHVFVTTAYNTGCALLEIIRSGDEFEAKEVYFLPAGQFSNQHGGVVLVGDYLYGGSGGNKGDPVCLDFASGEILWKQRAPGRGSAAVLYADGHLIFRYDRGPVYLVEATPEEYRVKGSFQPISAEGPAWPHPVIHDGKLYLRDHDVLMCYDVRGDQ